MLTPKTSLEPRDAIPVVSSTKAMAMGEVSTKAPSQTCTFAPEEQHRRSKLRECSTRLPWKNEWKEASRWSEKDVVFWSLAASFLGLHGFHRFRGPMNPNPCKSEAPSCAASCRLSSMSSSLYGFGENGRQLRSHELQLQSYSPVCVLPEPSRTSSAKFTVSGVLLSFGGIPRPQSFYAHALRLI